MSGQRRAYGHHTVAGGMARSGYSMSPGLALADRMRSRFSLAM